MGEGKERSRAVLDEGKANGTRIDERPSNAETTQQSWSSEYARIFSSPRTFFYGGSGIGMFPYSINGLFFLGKNTLGRIERLFFLCDFCNLIGVRKVVSPV